MENSFKVLSIDGGGIRGIFPAMILANLEAELKAQGVSKWRVYENFNLICGTSTGGIIAIALALGIPAKEIYELYINNASIIFGNKKGFFKSILKSSHSRDNLEKLIREIFVKYHNGEDGNDPRLKHCKTNVAIPIYDLMEGRPSVLKNNYHAAFVRDYHIPAFVAALATSAAPTYFDPYSSAYVDLNGLDKSFQNKVDGGVYANNPTLNGIVEAQKAFNIELKDISVLSIGTGFQRFCDSNNKRNNGHRKNWGIYYWMKEDDKKRLIDLFLQGQSQQIQNLISLLKNGIDKRESDNFQYLRIDTQLDEGCNIELDEIDKLKLEKLAEKASIEFQKNASELVNKFGTGKRAIGNQL